MRAIHPVLHWPPLCLLFLKSPAQAVGNVVRLWSAAASRWDAGKLRQSGLRKRPPLTDLEKKGLKDISPRLDSARWGWGVLRRRFNVGHKSLIRRHILVTADVGSVPSLPN
ncbi:hypothetical protein FB451DRAFT_1198017 [Mycena latifolia]|nr:hypothetical protein FB451DRAFT_1198017 [Mycena latifolia]